jgi:cytochrome c oxidase subunit II
MGSTGKVAFGTILGIGAITGILCYFAFGLVAPEPGIMTYVSREPPADSATSAPAASPEVDDGVQSAGNEPQNSTATAPSAGSNNGNGTISNATGGNASTTAAGQPAASGPPAATLTIPQGASVQGNEYYDPAELSVKVGDTIAVDNQDTTPHTVTNGKDATDPNMGKLFDTSIINAGDSADIVTADLKPGDYPYFCAVHPYMTGSLTVQ